jgi:DHA2 family multidrug resistance protein
MQALDTTIANVALPYMQGTLSASPDQINWVLTSYIVAAAIMTAPVGWIANRFGRKRTFIICSAGFTMASVMCGLAQDITQMVLFRLLQGVFGASLVPLSQAVMLDTYPLQERGKAMAIWGMGVMLGPILGPTLGGWLTDEYSWPWIFYINLPLGVLALAMTVVYVPDSKFRRHIEKIDYLGLLMMAVGIGCLQLFLERGERLDWFESAEITAYAVTCFAALGLFVIRQLESRHALVDLHLCRDVQYSAGLVMTFLLGASLYSTVFIFPVYVQTLMGYTAWQTGILILPSALASGLVMPVAARLMAKGVPARLIVVAGIIRARRTSCRR